VIVIRYLSLLVFITYVVQAAELKPETNAAFDRYVKLTEEGFSKNQGFENFLWLDHHSSEKSLVWLGQSVVSPLQTLDQGHEIEVPDGVIQHWLGVVYLEGTTLDKVRDVLLNFADYKAFFKQQVIDSKLIKHDGDQFDALVRFYKAQISTVVLNVNMTAKFALLDPARLSIACRSTHVGEVEHPKDKKKYDQERSPEAAAGDLWRLNMYWRLQQSDNGMYVELEVISLAREVGGLISPSRLLKGFQAFPRELTQGTIDSLTLLFPHHR
jgi:hypothetical protein